MAFWNTHPATTAELAAVSVVASAAAATAAGAVPADQRPATSGNYALLTMRPWGSAAGTFTLAANIWRCTRTHMRTPWTIAGLAVVTTVAAAVGTAAMRFGVWAPDPTTGRPGEQLLDWSAFGTIDLTQAPGTLALTTAGLVMPAGEYFVGIGWAGTAVTLPVFVSHAGLSAGTDSSVSNNTGYVYTASGATVPTPFVATAATTQGPMVLARIV